MLGHVMELSDAAMSQCVAAAFLIGEAVPESICKADTGQELAPSVSEAGRVLPVLDNARDFTPS